MAWAKPDGRALDTNQTHPSCLVFFVLRNLKVQDWLSWQSNHSVYTWSSRPSSWLPSPANEPVCTLQAPRQLLSDINNNHLQISSDIDFGIKRITDPGHNSMGAPLDLLSPLASSASQPQSYLERLAGRPGIYMRGLGVQVPASSHHKVHLLDIRWVPLGLQSLTTDLC